MGKKRNDSGIKKTEGEVGEVQYILRMPIGLRN